MSEDLTLTIAAGLVLVGLMAYTVLGGADFGGGIWDLFATGPRRNAQREAIAHAMGPVWEANHVWLIFVIVLLFTCFPFGFMPLGIALFLPLHLALLGIMLRGVAFVFRGYSGRAPTGDEADNNRPSWWGHVFGTASVISPFLLGLAFATVTQGTIRVAADRSVTIEGGLPWLQPYAIGCGLLALAACAYLAAVYLTVETRGELRDDFRRRAIIAGTATAALAIIVPALAWWEARWFVQRLFSGWALPVVIAGLVFFALSAWAVFGRRYRLSRWFAAGEIVLLLLGWGLAQHPYLIYPDITLSDAAAPLPTVQFLLLTVPFGALLLVPSLWLLIRVFKAT